MAVHLQQLAAHVNYFKSQLACAEADYENAVIAQYFQRAAFKAGDLSLAIAYGPPKIIINSER